MSPPRQFRQLGLHPFIDKAFTETAWHEPLGVSVLEMFRPIVLEQSNRLDDDAWRINSRLIDVVFLIAGTLHNPEGLHRVSVFDCSSGSKGRMILPTIITYIRYSPGTSCTFLPIRAEICPGSLVNPASVIVVALWLCAFMKETG